MFSPGFKMKLADFDTAIPIHHIGDESFTNQDNDGNRTYCSLPQIANAISPVANHRANRCSRSLSNL